MSLTPSRILMEHPEYFSDPYTILFLRSRVIEDDLVRSFLPEGKK